MLKLNSRKTVLAIATAAAMGSVNAAAQLEEVIVVAQKRAENLQDTVIAITAVSGDLMDELNISNSSDYEAVVPSLSVRNSPARLFIRGVGSGINYGFEQSVGTFTDGIYHAGNLMTGDNWNLYRKFAGKHVRISSINPHGYGAKADGPGNRFR